MLKSLMNTINKEKKFNLFKNLIILDFPLTKL
jgi:hypothetical protein